MMIVALHGVLAVCRALGEHLCGSSRITDVLGGGSFPPASGLPPNPVG